MQVLAKLETGKALFEFNPIIEQADGIVLSRGNLSLDVRPEKFALIQKAIVSKCNIAGKPVLVTRMLDSMMQVPNAARCDFSPQLQNHVAFALHSFIYSALTKGLLKQTFFKQENISCQRQKLPLHQYLFACSELTELL